VGGDSDILFLERRVQRTLNSNASYDPYTMYTRIPEIPARVDPLNATHLAVELAAQHESQHWRQSLGTTIGQFLCRLRDWQTRSLYTTRIAGHATLSTVAEALLAARGTLFEQWRQLEKRLRSLAREDRRVRLLMTAPGVGAIVGLTYASAIDDPGRFRSSKAVGAHFGLTPKKYQSGETDVTGRISKIGDGGVRTVLYEAANVILTRPVRNEPSIRPRH
jgi:transposase